MYLQYFQQQIISISAYKRNIPQFSESYFPQHIFGLWPTVWETLDKRYGLKKKCIYHQIWLKIWNKVYISHQCCDCILWIKKSVFKKIVLIYVCFLMLSLMSGDRSFFVKSLTWMFNTDEMNWVRLLSDFFCINWINFFCHLFSSYTCICILFVMKTFCYCYWNQQRISVFLYGKGNKRPIYSYISGPHPLKVGLIGRYQPLLRTGCTATIVEGSLHFRNITSLRFYSVLRCCKYIYSIFTIYSLY